MERYESRPEDYWEDPGDLSQPDYRVGPPAPPVPVDEYERRVAECERRGHQWRPWLDVKINGREIRIVDCAHCGQCPERTRSAVQDALNGAEPRSA